MQAGLSGLFLIGVLLIAACQTSEPVDDAGRRIARVQNKFLMESDLTNMAASAATPEDSALMANAYVERWVREQVMMHQAEKNIPKDLNIDELVRDYRASLIRYHYEKLIVEVELDSIVTQQEILANYQGKEDEFRLKEKYFKYNFIALPADDANMPKVEEWWSDHQDSSQWQLLMNYCAEAANFFALGKEDWISESELKGLLPEKMQTRQLRAGRTMRETVDGIRYFLKILENRDQGTISPLTIVEDQIKRVILHRRKIDLLESKIEETYERESELNNVQIFE